MYRSISILALVLLCVGCKQKPTNESVTPVNVETEVVAQTENFNKSVYVGIIEESVSSSLSFPVSGTILHILVDEGDRVTKGQTLATLDDSSLRQVYATAEATLKQARDAYSRMKQLHDAESLPDIKWIEVQTKLQQAESAFEIAKKNLDECILKAPFTGVVGKRLAASGETALPSTPVMTLLDVSNLKVRFAVPEQEVSTISNKSIISVKIEALGGLSYSCSDTEKSAAANPLAHTYDVRATLKGSQSEVLPGMVCTVEVSNSESGSYILLPLGCITQTSNGEHFVWKVVDNTAKRQRVRIGETRGNSVIIEEGLHVGDRVVIKGKQKIGEGSKIEW